ncbi:hypothetical protein V2J09_013915 [Rumex salicifolius]
MATQQASAYAGRAGVFSIRQVEDLFLFLLNDCKTTKELNKIHAHIIKSSLARSNFLASKMIDICCNIRAADYAVAIFDDVIEPNLFVYNATIRACCYGNKNDLGISLFKEMIEDQRACPNKFTYPFVIKCCGGIGGHNLGKQFHGCICKVGLLSNLTTKNALLDMYRKCDNMADAQKMFDDMPERNVVSWNCLISGYARLGQMKKARAFFDEMPERSAVSWTVMISGYTQIGCYMEALEVFREMQMVGVAPDEISVVSVLPACAQLGTLELGKWIHFYCEKNALVKKTNVSNALIEMYCTCGSIDEARQVFVDLPVRDVISWSTMIAGLANHGKGQEAISLFREMKKTATKPNGFTFVAILSACSHSGFLNQGLEYFESMKYEYKIEPSIHHYSCLVDLLGRGGQLNRALKVIEKMPMKPDAKIWGSLLSSCRTHSNLNVAEIAMERLMEFEPDDTGNYVMLSNIYADLGQWDDVSRIRKLIRSKSLKKTPGTRERGSRGFSTDMCWVMGVLQMHLRKRSHSPEILPDDNCDLC